MENKICQSCGMPIVDKSQYETNKDGKYKFWINSPFDEKEYSLLSDWIKTGTLKNTKIRGKPSDEN